jgi:UDP-N-acetylmuramate dehydrogenase
MDLGGLHIEPDAPIPTWFGIGGRADRLARPASIDELRRCLRIDPNLRLLGDGANLLVDDEGVGELVVCLSNRALAHWSIDRSSGRVVAQAGANLPKLILETVRLGLAGLEGLGGIPATIGGAAVMNAGGAFGQIADAIAKVHGLGRDGAAFTLERDEIDFRYRHSGLNHLILTSVEFELREEDPATLRARLKEVMEYKKGSQPMAERSAGCVWKNPTLLHDLPDIGPTGERVSAGMLIDRAGCKGLRVGGASVSPRHANFVVTELGARAHDVIELMDQTRRRVHDTFGVTLEPEVVIWKRDHHGDAGGAKSDEPGTK